jgi:ArsR family transcriptional regulator
MMDQLETLSGIYKALGDPTRLKLIRLLSGQPVVFCSGQCNGETFLCVGALANQLGVTQPAVSQHLRILRQAGLVRGERRGSFVHYSLNQEGLKQYRKLATQIMGDRF